jgi:hypothetical protein
MISQDILIAVIEKISLAWTWTLREMKMVDTESVCTYPKRKILTCCVPAIGDDRMVKI